jgi:hypothetical protein
MPETASRRNAGKDCVHKTQIGWTLHKQELRAPGWPFIIAPPPCEPGLFSEGVVGGSVRGVGIEE